MDSVQSSILKIGNVIAVEGRVIKVNVDKSKNASHLIYNGKAIKNVSVGSFIKITKGFEEIIGKIEGEFIVEERILGNKQYVSEQQKIKRVLVVSLMGFFNQDCFERGIKELPLINNDCYLLSEAEFSLVHDFIKKDDEPILIGRLSQEKGKSISVGINALFASHIGIFGNTGSGKSYTLAKLYHQLLQQYKEEAKFQKNAKFFLIDFNGEYVNEGEGDDNVIIEKHYKNVFRLSTRVKGKDKFSVSSEMLHDSTIWMILLEATEKTQTPFLKRALNNEYIQNRLDSEEHIKSLIEGIIVAITTNKDKTLEKGLVANFLHDIKEATESYADKVSDVQKSFASLQYHNTQNTFYFPTSAGDVYAEKRAFAVLCKDYIDQMRIDIEQASEIELIRLKILINYYDEIVKGYSNREHISPLIKRLSNRVPEMSKVIRVEDKAKPLPANFTIISLKDVNIHMRKVLPLLFCKQWYEEKKANASKETYLNIIIDEAHNILSSTSMRESEQWKDYRLETFEEIIKEGRKFGVFLTIASQRPFDISPTIISQLHNYFLHRLINNNDIDAIQKTVSYLDKVSFDSLPILPTGTCILAGLVAQVPVLVEIDRIDDQFKPFNQTIQPIDFWR